MTILLFCYNILTKLQTLRQATFAHGNGSHGTTSPNGPDALFSQGAVKTSAASNVLAAVCRQ